MSGTVTPAAVEAFPHRVAEHAASGALRDLLEHHRVAFGSGPPSEGAAFGLSGAFDFAVGTTGHVEGRSQSLELDCCRHLGLDARWLQADDPEAAWELLRGELDAGHPTLVRADIGELDYYADRRHDTRHAIVVTRYDPSEEVAWVVDRRFPEQQRCTLAALATASASCAWPGPARHGLLRLRRPARPAPPKVAIAAALSRAVANMRHPRAAGRVGGLACLDALLAVWAGPRAGGGDERPVAIATLGARVRDGGSGGALYRSLQARFEHDAAALLESPTLGRAALVCDDLADAWRALGTATDDACGGRAPELATVLLRRIRVLEQRHVAALELHLAGRHDGAS